MLNCLPMTQISQLKNHICLMFWKWNWALSAARRRPWTQHALRQRMKREKDGGQLQQRLYWARPLSASLTDSSRVSSAHGTVTAGAAPGSASTLRVGVEREGEGPRDATGARRHVLRVRSAKVVLSVASSAEPRLEPGGHAVRARACAAAAAVGRGLAYISSDITNISGELCNRPARMCSSSITRTKSGNERTLDQ